MATTSPLLRVAPYAGAFLGPFAGNAVNVLLPVLQQTYAVDVRLAALSLTAYMVPFAAAQFVSGMVADRYGRRQVLTVGFAAFGLSSLGCALASGYGLFLVARAGQGLANACTTPILMALLGDEAEPRRLGRSLGWFSSANTAGLFLAPLVSGALAVWNWRLVFVLLAAACAPLALLYASGIQWQRGQRAAASQRGMGGSRGALADVLTPALGALCASAMLGYLSLNGVGFVVALDAAARFGLAPKESGLLLSCFGLAVMLASAPAGFAVDRLGSVRVSATGTVGAAVVLALLPAAPAPGAVGALLLVGGTAVAALWAGLTKLAVQAAPERRATASSWFNAWKFVGYAVAPLLYAPVYAAFGAGVAFGVAAAATTLILLPLAYLARRTGVAGSLPAAADGTARHACTPASLADPAGCLDRVGDRQRPR